MEKIDLTIIVPVFNAGSFLEDSLAELSDWSSGRQGVELIFVDDGSTDASSRILMSFKGRFPVCKILTNKPNRGKGFSLKEGMRAADGYLVAFTDADLPYGLEIFDEMKKEMDADLKLSFIYGSRSHRDSDFKNYGIIRSFGRDFFSGIIRSFVVPGIFDTQCGVKMFRKGFADAVVARSIIDHFAFDIELFVIARMNSFKIKDFRVKLLENKESSVRIIRDTIFMLSDIARIRTRMKAGGYRYL